MAGGLHQSHTHPIRSSATGTVVGILFKQGCSILGQCTVRGQPWGSKLEQDVTRFTGVGQAVCAHANFLPAVPDPSEDTCKFLKQNKHRTHPC